MARVSHHSSISSNRSQAFDHQRDVNPPNFDTDFTNVEENKVKVVDGRGQEVEWRQSSVTVIETDDKGKPTYTPLPNNKDGRLSVKEGWKLYIVEGKFCEIVEKSTTSG
jgi:hypothetical protein